MPTVRLQPIRILIICSWFLFCVNNLNAAANNRLSSGNESSGGGDWFVTHLPLLKFELPEEEGAREGIYFKRIGLPKCTLSDQKLLSEDSDNYVTSYLPNRAWQAVRVLVHNGRQLVCSFGHMPKDQESSLDLLVNNENTNRIILDPANPKSLRPIYSKSSGLNYKYGFFAVGTYLITGKLFGINFQFNSCGPTIGDMVLFGYPKTENAADFVYVTTGIEPSDRIYFLQTMISSKKPAWRILLPIALPQNEIPLPQIAEQIAKDGCPRFGNVHFDDNVPQKYTDMYAWSMFNITRTSLNLRLKIAWQEGVSFLGMLARPDWLAPHFTLYLTPSIVGSDLNHAAFHHSGENGKIFIPIGTPAWRMSADVVHELTHVLQLKNGRGNSDDDRFQNEMEAHLNEREHVVELSKVFNTSPQMYAQLLQVFTYTASATLPLVRWVNGETAPHRMSLCDQVIETYKLNRNHISSESLNRFNCSH